MKNTNASVARQLAGLADIDMDGLRRKFAELHGFQPSTLNFETLRKRVAYKIQEVAFGGLSRKTVELLDSIADADDLACLRNGAAKKFSQARGTRYVREWKGQTHEVYVLGGGKFEYNGEVFGSLTAIAERITGTHWNGKRFFGVK